MDLLAALLIARLVDPVVVLIGAAFGVVVSKWWAPAAVGVVAAATAGLVHDSLGSAPPSGLAGFLAASLAGAIWVWAVWGVRIALRARRRRGPPPEQGPH